MSNFVPWKIRHLDLSEGIYPLPAEPNCQGLYLVFWWHGIPLGHQMIPAAQLPIPATQLANLAVQTITPAVGDQLLPKGCNLPLAQHSCPHSQVAPSFHSLLTLENPLEKLWERRSNAVDESIGETVSVVICTRDRPEQLEQCLQSLQNLSHGPREIVVVDNAPTTDTTRQLVSQMPDTRYVLEPRSGLSVARNTGIRHSKGDIIAFTDDDVTVHPDWIARLKQSFRNPQVIAVTGLVIPAELETESQVTFEMELGYLSGEFSTRTFGREFFQATKHSGVPVWRIGAGANMAFRRQAFELVGNFDERLGAGASGCSEDSELWYRILAGGWLCCYEPSAVVFHSHRRELDCLKQQMYQYMCGHVAALLIQFARYKHWGNLRRLFWSLPTYYAGLLAIGLLRGFGPRYKTYLAEISGCLAGIKFYLQNRDSDKGLQKHT
jgi:glycosyltransferase involved in cell wall biosynthesis